MLSISNDNKLSNSATAKQISLVTAQEISNNKGNENMREISSWDGISYIKAIGS